MKQTLTKGFRAVKIGHLQYDLKTEVYELGFYIFTFKGGKLLDQTARKSLDKAKLFIQQYKETLEASGYYVEFYPKVHNIKQNSKTLKYQISL